MSSSGTSSKRKGHEDHDRPSQEPPPPSTGRRTQEELDRQFADRYTSSDRQYMSLKNQPLSKPIVMVVCGLFLLGLVVSIEAADPCVPVADGGTAGYHLRCQEASLATISLQLKNYSGKAGRLLDTGRLDALTTLDITHSSIRKLSGPIFEGLQLINKLSVTYSGVDTIEEAVFAPLIGSLNELDLEGNGLQSVPSKAIDKLANLTRLNLSHNKIAALATQTFSKLTSLFDVNLAHNQIKSMHASAFSGASSIEHLQLQSNQLSKLERGLFRTVKKLKVLDLSFNNFTGFDRQDFVELSNLLHLNLSSNQLSKLPQSTFTRNSQLLSINLSGNRLTEVDAYILRGIRFLREFHAADNLIASVARRAFGSTTRLRKLDLSGNLLTSIEPDIFANMQFLDILDLSGNRLENISTDAFKSIYKVAIDLSHNQLSRIDPRAFVEVANITVLNLAHNNLSSLPRDVFEETDVCQLLLQYNLFQNASLIPISNLTGIKVLNVSHNQLTEIDRKAFANSKKLYEMELVDLSHNQIKDLSGSVFEKFWALRHLNLSDNRIRKIGFGAFGNLPTLLELDLSQNAITDINSAGISNLISLKTLFLHRNQLKKFFRIPPALNEIHLESNQLKRIPAGAFPMINSLLSIHLDRNNLTEIQPGAFRNLLTLRHLSLGHNAFSNVSQLAPALAEAASLQYLELSGNRIETIEPRAFGNLPVVFELRLDSNRISEVSDDAFNGLLQLINLTMANNSLSRLPGEAFRGLVSLRRLDLSHNALTRLENKTHSVLEPLLSLEQLGLAHNRFSFLAVKSFPASQYIPNKLRWLDLSHNLLDSLQSTVGLSSVEHLNISHNGLRSISPHILSNCSQLRTVDLSANQLTKLDGYFSNAATAAAAANPQTGLGGSSTILERLSTIILNHNRIEQLPAAELLSLKDLHRIDVSYNKLTAIPDEFVVLAKRSVAINVTGNPLLCDCQTRRVIDRARINQPPTAIESDWNVLRCSDGRVITSLDPTELNCSAGERDDVLSGDLLFRGSQWVRRDSLLVVWLVRNAKAEIWTFQLTLQPHVDGDIEPCTPDKCLSSIELPYNHRSYTFDGLDSRRSFYVCINAMNGNVSSTSSSPVAVHRSCMVASARTL